MTNKESANKDLTIKIEELHARYPEISFAKLSRVVINVAKWEKEQLVTWLSNEANYLIQELENGNKAYGLAERYRAQIYKEIINKLKDE